MDYKLPVIEEFPQDLPGVWVSDDQLENKFPHAWRLFRDKTPINPSQELTWPYASD